MYDVAASGEDHVYYTPVEDGHTAQTLNWPKDKDHKDIVPAGFLSSAQYYQGNSPGHLGCCYAPHMGGSQDPWIEGWIASQPFTCRISF